MCKGMYVLPTTPPVDLIGPTPAFLPATVLPQHSGASRDTGNIENVIELLCRIVAASATKTPRRRTQLSLLASAAGPTSI